MIVDVHLIKLLTRNVLFHSVNQSFVDTFINVKNFFVAKEGTLLYSYTDDSTSVFLIVEGEVKIKFPDGIKYKYLLDFFGEKEILDNSPRKSCAITNKECILYRISCDELNSLILDYPIIQNNFKKVGYKQSPNLDETLTAQT